MSVMLTNRRVLTSKIEAVYNVDIVPAANVNAKYVEGLNWSFEAPKMVQRNAVKITFDKLKQLYAGSLFSVSFDKEVKGSGVAGTAPEIGTLFRACGLGEIINAGVSVIYKPVSVALESVTCYLYEDGVLYKITGCRGEVGFKLGVGARVMATFKMQGHFSGPTDVALAAPTYEATLPPIWIGAPFQIGGYGPVISKLDFNMGNALSNLPDVSSADGFGEVIIHGRDVKGSFDPQMTTIAARDWVNKWKTNAEEALTSGPIGATAGNIVQFDMPKVSSQTVAPADRTGARALAIGFGAAENAGDDSVAITFT